MIQLAEMKEHFIKIETAAQIIDVSIWTLRKWVKQRKIRSYRFGRVVRIRESDILRIASVRPSKKELAEKLDVQK